MLLTRVAKTDIVARKETDPAPLENEPVARHTRACRAQPQPSPRAESVSHRTRSLKVLQPNTPPYSVYSAIWPYMF